MQHINDEDLDDVAPERHAVLLFDQAGWQLSHKLVVPLNITLLPLPPKCPELNPMVFSAVAPPGWRSPAIMATTPLWGKSEMRCPQCCSTSVKKRPELTAQGYRRFRCLDCGKQFNEPAVC